MKRIILISFILLYAGISSNAQFTSGNHLVAKTNFVSPGSFFSAGKYNSVPAENNKADYLKKSRDLKTAGWCFVGAGAVGLAIGLASFPKNADIIFTSEEDQAKADRATTITIIGSALMIGSLPFFIIANANKKKAKLAVGSQRTGFGVPATVSKGITGVSVMIPIGK